MAPGQPLVLKSRIGLRPSIARFLVTGLATFAVGLAPTCPRIVNYGAVLLTLIRLVPGSVLAANGALTTRQLAGRKRAFPHQELVVKIKTESLVIIRAFLRNRPKVGLSINASASGEPFICGHPHSQLTI
jgi:hypothetical protein